MTYSYSLLILVALTLLANSAILPFSITPPCPTGKTAVDNGVPVTSNGCGSGPTQAKLAKNLIPFLTVLTPCCDDHDVCYGTCVSSNYLAVFNGCNNAINNCMFSQCDAHAKTISNKIKAAAAKLLCKTTATLIYQGVSNLGKKFYEQAQKEHCSCT